jgi:hypothetical protein
MVKYRGIIMSGTCGQKQSRGEHMKRRKKTIVLFCTLFCLTILSGWQVPPGNSAELFEEMSTEGLLYTRGLISSVSLDKMQIAVRPPKDKRIVITIDPDTIFEGVKRIDELQKKQQVKVWYSPADDQNKAVKIKKMMDLGC